MPIRQGARAAALGFSVPELHSRFPTVHFGTAEDVKSKQDLPDGLQVIFMGPTLVPGHRDRIRSCGTAKNVAVIDKVGTESLQARLQPYVNGQGSAEPGASAPPLIPQRQVLALVIGAESAHTFKQKYELEGIRFLQPVQIRPEQPVLSVLFYLVRALNFSLFQ